MRRKKSYWEVQTAEKKIDILGALRDEVRILATPLYATQ